MNKKDCPECRGTGHDLVLLGAYCRICDGTGKACELCDGKGYVVSSDGLCSRCVCLGGDDEA